jgi:hypothetical protein
MLRNNIEKLKDHLIKLEIQNIKNWWKK